MPHDAEGHAPGHRVVGTVRRPDRSPLAVAAVLAFDRDLGDGEPLGRATTDDQGRYELRYGVERLRVYGKDSADLIVRAFAAGPTGGPLAESDVLPAAPPDARVNLVAAGQDGSGTSEFERHVSALGRRDPAGIDDDAAIELSTETGIDRDGILSLVRSHRLAQETAVPAEALYGLRGRGTLTDLDALLALPAKALRRRLAAAVKRRAVPAAIAPHIASVARRLSAYRRLTGPLGDLAPAMGLEPDAPLFAALAERGMTSLRDVRDNGGLPDLDEPLAWVVEAHAALSVLPIDAATAAHLVTAGFPTVEEVARTPRAAFVSALGGHLPATTAGAVHEAATLQAPYLSSVLNDLRLSASPTGPGGTTGSAVLAAALPATCECRDCNSATSPAAYLADLLDYTLGRLTHNGAPVTLSFLESRFHQPFSELPLSCEATDTRIRQVHVCIEVLRGQLGPPYDTHTPGWYLTAAYTRLLEEIGTSFDELRGSDADRGEREALADRLGLFVDPAERPDILEELTMDPAALTARELERVFGLRDTTRAPLEGETESSHLAARRRYLRELLWWRADWPSDPAHDAPPLVDPDVVGPADMLYALLTPPGRPRTPTSPIHLWEDRQQQIQDWRRTIREVREDPRAGFEALITDRTVIDGRPVRFHVGLAITREEFTALRDRRRAGEDLAADLAALHITLDGFDVFVRILDTLGRRPVAPVLDAEWEDIADILVHRLKRLARKTWRAEEKELSLTVGPDHFKLRTGEEWLPRPWRSTREDRLRWEDTLRARIDQDRTVLDAARSAVAVVEDALLAELRDELIRRWSPPPGTPTSDKAETLTQLLRIDCKAGACQETTRIAQAVETIQGLLFGVRNGLLEDSAYGLDAPFFDEEWRWMGSYASWRAAMQVFLHPENALQPMLRRPQSLAFKQLVTDLQQSVPVTPDTARAAADTYARYFHDICSLAPVAAYGSGLVIARGVSGRLYFANFEQPAFGHLAFVPDHTLWQEIGGLPADAEIVGLVSYQERVGAPSIGLYARLRRDGGETYCFSSYDGTGWTQQPISELPVLVTSAEYRDGIVPADPGLPVKGWRLRGSDRLIPIHAEGTGSRNRTAVLVVAGETEPDGRRRIGLLRGRDGGLRLTSFATLDGAWRLPPGEPIRLWHNGIQRVVMTRPDGTATQLGLLGTNWPQDLSVGIVWQTDDGFVHAPDGSRWRVTTTVPLTAAELDNGFATSLLTLEYGITEDQHGWRDTATTTHVLRSHGRGLQLQSRFSATNPYHEAPDSCSSPVHVHVNQLLPCRFGPSATYLVIGQHAHRPTIAGLCTTSVYAPTFCWEAAWQQTSARLTTRGTVPETNTVPPTVLLGPDDRFLPLPLPNGTEGALLPPTASRPDITVVAHRGNALRVTWRSTGGAVDAVTPSTAGAWTLRPDDRYTPIGQSADRQVLAVRADGSEIAGLRALDTDGRLGVDWRVGPRVAVPGADRSRGWLMAPDTRYTALDLDGDGGREILALTPDGRLGVLHAVASARSAQLAAQELRNVGPINVAARDVISRNMPTWGDDRKRLIEEAYASNASPSLRRYLDEAYFFVPLQIAQRLRESGHHTAALDWLRSVYDYERPLAERKIGYRLVIDEHPNEPAGAYVRAPDWTADPLNPHAIAETRAGSYTRFTLLAVVRCLIDHADAEFTRATSESVPRARELYIEALELLALPELTTRPSSCAEWIAELPEQVGEDEYRWVWQDIRDRLSGIGDLPRLRSAVERLKDVLANDDSTAEQLATAQRIVRDAATEPSVTTYPRLAARDREARRRAQTALLGHRTTADRAARIGDPLRAPLPGKAVRLPALSFVFCVPPNPIIDATRDHARMNLEKIRACRNIAGLEMRLDPYALPTVSDMAGAERPALQPLPYRYAALIERVKQLVQLAAQIESSLLGSLQSLGQARYESLKARQDLSLAHAGVRLKDLQLVEATDGIAAAQLQCQRAQLQSAHYRDLIGRGLNASEGAALGAMSAAVAAEFAGIYSPETFLEWFGSAAPALGRLADLTSTVASYERRAEDWRLQRDLAAQDVRAGLQQVQLAHDRTRIAAQDRAIAALQADHAEAMVEFIETQRFGNEALYAWMSGVLEQIYRFFLQHATSIARLAEAQLAFERQEVPPAIIRSDYWEAPTAGGGNGRPREVHGLTGSARLLRDIYELDQHAFTTNQRKLHLTETISLARLDPIAFQRFRESGVLPFATPMELFDRRFPGHYLRLVRRVRTSVIALVPPAQGIRATLATTGTSRVVIGGPAFSTVRIQRGPESVALTAPIDASGVFELDPQPDLLVPFEGIGVDTTWELRLPKPANPIDYGAIADVLVAIDYSALDSVDHRRHVLQRLDPRVRADRPFSFRRDFPDAWYDLHHPELVADAEHMVVRFRTERDDFPPNLDALRVDQLVLCFAGVDGNAVPIRRTALTFAPDNAANTVEEVAQPVRGKVSTRSGAWPGMLTGLTPVGEWTLSLRPAADDPQRQQKLDAIEAWFTSERKGERYQDILFVVTYSGRSPAWP
ncbi:neuraminidase-like domain-containing protein [Streptomyces sp. NPDC021056]|uniref:Tc toxin subunit A-related protein n=1 Tax=Streptomyces sp. NPDC021056 TaxID=3155012 RepID=UPI0033DB8E0B